LGHFGVSDRDFGRRPSLVFVEVYQDRGHVDLFFSLVIFSFSKTKAQAGDKDVLKAIASTQREAEEALTDLIYLLVLL
jgi:hypothetical protein